MNIRSMTARIQKKLTKGSIKKRKTLKYSKINTARKKKILSFSSIRKNWKNRSKKISY